uniref:Uncharacterized protein n=1 Tax=viral metagenome TaxID=1070528 RepID=A0A6C0KY28_9ZZZZ
MSVKTHTYLAKVIAGHCKEGGGHTIESAFFEQPDNSIDAGATEIIIGYSPSKFTFINADNGRGAPDIHSLWGCGNIVSKTGEDIGKKMIGELSSSLYYGPKHLRYKSVCECKIQSQYAHLDLENITRIVMQPNKLQKDANDEIEQYIDVQAKRNKSIHQDDIRKLHEIVCENDEFVNKIENSENKSGLIKFMEFDEHSEKFRKIVSDIPRLAQLMNMFIYNKLLRSGLVIKIINLDDPTKNIILNSETASQTHILGKNSIIRDDEEFELGSVEFSSDFGNIDLKRVHVFNYDVYKGGKWSVQYVNTKCIDKYEFVSEKLKKNDSLELGGELVGSARVYISKIDECEREQQKKQLQITNSEELRKAHIMLNIGNNEVRGLCRGNYPTSWGIALRNLKDTSFIICFDGESEIANVSGNKSSFNMENMNCHFLEIVKETAVRVLKGCYTYAKWDSIEEDKNILQRREELKQIFNNKRKQSGIKKRKQMKKSDAQTVIEEMSQDDLESNRDVLLKMIAKNVDKITDVNVIKSLLLEQVFLNIDDPQTIIAEASSLQFQEKEKEEEEN